MYHTVFNAQIRPSFKMDHAFNKILLLNLKEIILQIYLKPIIKTIVMLLIPLVIINIQIQALSKIKSILMSVKIIIA